MFTPNHGERALAGPVVPGLVEALQVGSTTGSAKVPTGRSRLWWRVAPRSSVAAAREARPRCVRPKGRGQDLTRYGERALDTRGGGERGEHAGPRRATENPSSAAAVELETWGASAETPSRALRSRRKAKLNQLEAEVEQFRALVPTADVQAIAPRPVAPQRESFEYDAAYRRARYSHQRWTTIRLRTVHMPDETT